MAKVPEEIRKAWANQNLIPVVGAGVSISAAGLPNWPDLLMRGIEYARANMGDLRCSLEAIQALEAAARANQLLHGFAQLQELWADLRKVRTTKPSWMRFFQNQRFAITKLSIA